MTTNFYKVVFTDEIRATFDGPDGWSKGRVANACASSCRLRHPQGGGGIMIWAGIIDGIMIRPWRVSEEIQITAETYIAILKEHLGPWFKRQRITFRRTMMFMQDNAPYHSAKSTSEYLQQLGFSGPRFMKQPECSPDLNPIENIWSVLKRQVYWDGRKFSSTDALWEAILDAARSIIAEQICG